MRDGRFLSSTTRALRTARHNAISVYLETLLVTFCVYKILPVRFCIYKNIPVRFCIHKMLLVRFCMFFYIQKHTGKILCIQKFTGMILCIQKCNFRGDFRQTLNVNPVNVIQHTCLKFTPCIEYMFDNISCENYDRTSNDVDVVNV